MDIPWRITTTDDHTGASACSTSKGHPRSSFIGNQFQGFAVQNLNEIHIGLFRKYRVIGNFLSQFFEIGSFHFFEIGCFHLLEPYHRVNGAHETAADFNLPIFQLKLLL